MIGRSTTPCWGLKVEMGEKAWHATLLSRGRGTRQHANRGVIRAHVWWAQQARLSRPDHARENEKRAPKRCPPKQGSLISFMLRKLSHVGEKGGDVVSVIYPGLVLIILYAALFAQFDLAESLGLGIFAPPLQLVGLLALVHSLLPELVQLTELCTALLFVPRKREKSRSVLASIAPDHVSKMDRSNWPLLCVGNESESTGLSG